MKQELWQEITGKLQTMFHDVFEHPLIKTWDGSDPVAAFDDDDMFTSKNWNDSRINLFRALFSGLFHDGISNEVVFTNLFTIVHDWRDDQNFVFIHQQCTDALYYISWYKNRGCTELFLHNGHPITLSDFKELLINLMTGTLKEVLDE